MYINFYKQIENKRNNIELYLLDSKKNKLSIFFNRRSESLYIKYSISFST